MFNSSCCQLDNQSIGNRTHTSIIRHRIEIDLLIHWIGLVGVHHWLLRVRHACSLSVHLHRLSIGIRLVRIFHLDLRFHLQFVLHVHGLSMHHVRVVLSLVMIGILHIRVHIHRLSVIHVHRLHGGIHLILVGVVLLRHLTLRNGHLSHRRSRGNNNQHSTTAHTYNRKKRGVGTPREMYGHGLRVGVGI